MNKFSPHYFKKNSLYALCIGLFFSFCLFSAVVSAQEGNQQMPMNQEIQAAPETSEGKIVKAIDIKGNKTISIATILSKIKTRVGQPYLQAVLSDDLKRLYNTGYFSDVHVDRVDEEGGFKVVIYLVEKPIVEEVTFSRIRHFKPKVLAKKLKTQVGTFMDNKLVKDDINTVKDLYAQKGLTKVEVEAETFVDDATNKASLHFVITEGQKIRIKRINVFGNAAYKDKKILNIIKSRKKWVFNSGYLKEDVLTEDMERIILFYEQNGYIDATAQNTVESLAKGFVNINIEINEGKRYYVGSLSIAGNNIMSESQVLKQMEEIEVGGIFSREKLSVDLVKIRTLYFDQGYIFANVKDATALDPETGRVDITLNIVEGGIAYIDKVRIQGNTRTRDIVIRRELKLYPGDRFDGEKLRRSRERFLKYS